MKMLKMIRFIETGTKQKKKPCPVVQSPFLVTLQHRFWIRASLRSASSSSTAQCVYPNKLCWSNVGLSLPPQSCFVQLLRERGASDCVLRTPALLQHPAALWTAVTTTMVWERPGEQEEERGGERIRERERVREGRGTSLPPPSQNSPMLPKSWQIKPKTLSPSLSSLQSWNLSLTVFGIKIARSIFLSYSN